MSEFDIRISFEHGPASQWRRISAPSAAEAVLKLFPLIRKDLRRLEIFPKGTYQEFEPDELEADNDELPKKAFPPFF